MRRLVLWLLLLALPATVIMGADTDKPASPAPPAPLWPTHVLSLSLLLASDQPAASSKPLPGAVSKAINDLKDFLPYRSYDIQDTVVVRTLPRNPTAVVLQGPDARYNGFL